MTQNEERPEKAEDATVEQANEAPDEADQPQEGDLQAELIAAFESQIKDLDEQRLRLAAELENTRKRAQREVEDASAYAIRRFARDILEVGDNLTRALSSVPADKVDGDPMLKVLVEGLEMTERTLQGALERHRIKRIEPEAGEKFDHNRHQAMYEQETAAHPPGTVAQVMQCGYTLADQLLRPALVGVAKAPPKPSSAGETGGPNSAGEAGDDDDRSGQRTDRAS